MADVGRLANVSAQTVSRYFTGSGYVSAKTRAKIEAAIEALGYRFNHVARNLRVNRTNNVGVLTMGPINYGTSSITTGISRAARAAGYSVTIAQVELSAGDPAALAEARHAIERFLTIQVDGIVLATPYRGSAALIADLPDSLPALALADEPGLAESQAGTSYQAARLAIRHLAELGHERILHLAGPESRNETFERLRGYEDGLAEFGFTPLPVAHAREWDAESGFLLGQRSDLEFSAVFAGDDELAVGFMAAMRARGRTSPEDFSIIGIDDVPNAAYLQPALTTVRVDFADVGRRAFETIHTWIEGSDKEPRATTPPTLVVRASTRRPGGRVRAHTAGG
ncbi:LacI family DNA-binding transcriptional regulator [Dactylosporangium sp. CA-233914]|uniref:LacI family DNA-binding transcriptional regulator n=1 Tax=Dactylosporangium sp. CA-233914 TaxID=3239934 RepID=UPI003D91957A